MTEVDPYWKSILGDKALRNESAEWIRRRERRKISNMDLRPIQSMEITSFLLKTLNWKSPRSDKIQNYWFLAFLAAYLHITKYFIAIMKEPEKVPEWLTTGIRRQQGSQKLPTYTSLTTMYKTPTGVMASRISAHLKSRAVYQQSKQNFTVEVKGARFN
jgi:hypothetical protein